MADAHRSIHPDIPGVPWWAALLIATTATAIGYLIDAGSGHKELTHIFAGFYIAGCVAAVLAVRQEGVFTAIIQPPLILFCAVPGAYWLFHGGKIGHLKDLLINCGYPLIERFPLMLGTAGGVLLIGLARWYFGMSHRATSAGNTSDNAAGSTAAKSFVSGIAAKLSSVLRPESDENDTGEAPAARRGRSGSAAAKSRRAGRSGPSDTRSARTRSRHARRPLDDAQEPPVERPRRRSRRDPAASRDYDTPEPSRRSQRRPRPEADPGLRGQSAREARREPRSRSSSYERPVPRSSRFDHYDRYDAPGTPEHFGRYEPRERYDRYEPPCEPPHEPNRRRATPTGTNPTHHPISQVRYRGAPPLDEPRVEPRPERRSRPRTHGRSQGRPTAESWDYDV